MNSGEPKGPAEGTVGSAGARPSSPTTAAKPDLVLRLGFAGNRALPENIGPLKESLAAIYSTIAGRLAEIVPRETVPGTPRVARFYSTKVPTLRLITGLAEGGDALAMDTFAGLAEKNFQKEFAAVVPSDVLTYRNTRQPEFCDHFDSLVQQCDYVLELDGQLPPGDTEEIKWARAQAYRAQSKFLLRHADILIVAVNPENQAKVGGSMETLHSALAFHIPAIRVNTTNGDIRLADPEDDLVEVLTAPRKESKDSWTKRLRDWVDVIVADPAVESDHPPLDLPLPDEPINTYDDSLLREYFGEETAQPTGSIWKRGRDSYKSVRGWLWSKIEVRFRPAGLPSPVSDPPLQPYATYRALAAKFNGYYAGLYRGAFVANYGLAVIAVALAVINLLNTWGAPEGEHPWSLKFFEALKLFVLVLIFANTYQAEHGGWNDKSVDFRYLAERLRALNYLPRIGCFQAPDAIPLHYSRRRMRQSGIDWLFEAIVRSVSPANFAKPATLEISPTKRIAFKSIKLDLGNLLTDVRDKWVTGQSRYHLRNKFTMARLNSFSKSCVKWINVGVILIVIAELVIFTTHIDKHVPDLCSHCLHFCEPYLGFAIAVLPAVVASLNSIRFQSECQRLADRSEMMVTLLEARRKNAAALQLVIEQRRNVTANYPDVMSVEVLKLCEGVAMDLAKEVSDWTVLYAKELPET